MTATNYAAADDSVQARSRDRFFFFMSGLLLLILLVGFSRTLYLRLFFEVPPVPFYLHVHGATVTAWFVTWIAWANFHMLLGFVAFLATPLLLSRRTDIHKQACSYRHNIRWPLLHPRRVRAGFDCRHGLRSKLRSWTGVGTAAGW